MKEDCGGCHPSFPFCSQFRAAWRTMPKVQDLCLTSPGLVFTTRRLEKTNRRVGNTNRRLRKTTRRLVRAISPTMPMAWNCPIMCARVYAFDFPKKVFTPSHIACFLLIFIGFWCEGFDFKVFTWAAKHSHGR